MQVADACSTLAGVAQFGVRIEANPLILFLISTYGVTSALIVAKTVAILGGTVLYLSSRHLLLAVLTVAYVYAALVPWAWVLKL